MNSEALQDTLKLLKELPKEQFCMDSWSTEHTCCAVGLSFSNPEFSAKHGGYLANSRYPRCADVADRLTGWDSVAHVYGVELLTATRMFLAACYKSQPSKKKVSKRIKYLIKHGEEAFLKKYE